MNFTVTAQGIGCNVKEKRASLQLDDKKVFSAVVEIAKDEFVLNKVGSNFNLFFHGSSVYGRKRAKLFYDF